jgi:hypothetical protein
MNLKDELPIIEMSDSIKSWVTLAPGEFSCFDVDRDLDLQGVDIKRVRTLALEKLVEEGVLDHVGSRRGFYRPAKRELESIDMAEADDTPLDIWLPFAMHKLVNVLPGNIITIGGEKNAGKTSYLLNLAFDNRNRFQVHYFNSEMGPGEIKLRCQKYCESNRIGFSEWNKVNFYERSDAFSDVIFTGKNSLNIIDFYECHDEFYKMGEGIRKIHDRLDGGLAFIAIQKNPGNDDPVGGRRVTEKSRVHVNISYNYGIEYPHKLKIVVGKNWADPTVNPTGYCVDYKLANGCYFKTAVNPHEPTKWWYYSK